MRRAADLAGNVALAMALGVVLWEAARLAPPLHRLPATVEVARALVAGVADASMLHAARSTLTTLALALALAAVAGVPLGVLIGSSDTVERYSRTVVEFSRSVPAVVLIPVAVVLIGIGSQMRITVAAFSALWPLVFHAKAGAENVEQLLRDSARVLGHGKAATAWRVVVPSCLPYVMTGLRLAASTALVVVITIELLVGNGHSGLGGEMEHGRQAGRPEIVWAATVAAGVVGLLVNLVLAGVQDRLTWWAVEDSRDRSR